MSRLQALHVPFSAGRDDTVDDRVLPDGVFDELSNGRLTRAGELRLRGGWRPVDTATVGEDGSDGGNPTFHQLYSTSRGLSALVTDADGLLAVQTYSNPGGDAPWVRAVDQALSPVTDVAARGGVEDLDADVLRASCAVAGGLGATMAQSSAAAVLRVYRLDTDETLTYDTLADASARKVFSAGGQIGQAVASTDGITLSLLDPDAAIPAFTNVAEDTGAEPDAFDVVATATAFHVVRVIDGAATYNQYTTDDGDEVGTGKTLAASGAAAAWVAVDATHVHVAIQGSDGHVDVLSFSATSPFTTSAGPTEVKDQAYVAGRVAIGRTSDRIHVAAYKAVVSATDVFSLTDAHTIDEESITLAVLVSGWLTDGPYAAVGLAPAATTANGETPRDVYYADPERMWFPISHGLGSVSATGAVWTPGQSSDGRFATPWPRLSNATPAQSRALGEGATRQVGVATGRIDADVYRPSVTFDRATYIAGGTLGHVTGGAPVEVGFVRPQINLLVGSTTSGLGVGTYRYRAVVVWTDRAGAVHRSPPSPPAEAEIESENGAVTASVFVAPTGRRLRSSLAGQLPSVELYRTEAGGELFYIVATAPLDDADDDVVTISDTTADSLALLDNRRIYTEGEFGATSGALAIAMPDPSTLVAQLRDRLVLAVDGAVQVSQIALPGEPVSFTQPGISGTPALAYRLRVDADVTALATLDQTIVVGTRGGIFVTSADGGPNLAGQGEFPSLARLPSDVGVSQARGIVEDSTGLWFVGYPADAGRLYVLPRGQGAPVAAGLPVRDIVAAGTVVGGAVASADDVTTWAVGAKAVSRHAQAPNPWVVDALPFTAADIVAYDGGLMAVDTSGGVWHYDPDTYGDGTSGGTAVALQVTTGDVQPFGLAGHGRLAVIEALVEHVSNATLKAEISYDFGATWTDLGSFTVTADGPVQWRPARQRGGKFRLRLTMTPSSTTAEGCRLTGFSLYYRPASGPSRLASANRK